MAYAEGTTVPPEKSQAEIMQTLRRYGATGFFYGEADGTAMVAFRANDRQVRFTLPLDIDRTQFSVTDGGRRRDPGSITAKVEGEHRRRWRALSLAIKAKLEVVETGISTFEEEFMAHIVLPSGQTVGEFMSPQIDRAYTTSEMPALLPGGSS